MGLYVMPVNGIEDQRKALRQVQMWHRVPRARELFVGIRNLDHSCVERVAGRQQMAAFSQKAVAGVLQSIDGIREERQHAADIGNNHVYPLGKMHLARITSHKNNSLRKPVGGGELASEIHN